MSVRSLANAKDAQNLFAGPGEMRSRCLAFDWSSTPLGPVSRWSQSLRTTVSIMLGSRHPMFLWWGHELIQIFNDGYLPSFGTTGRDKLALGARGREHWAEIWPIIGPQIDAVMTRGEATWHEDHFVPIERNGRLDNVWWTYGYSPVRDDDGSIRGVLVVVQETTKRVMDATERERLLAAERAAREEADIAREELTRVFTSAPVGIAVFHGRDLRFSIANPSHQKLIGGRNPVGKRFSEVFPDLAGSEIEGILQRVFETGEPFAANDFLISFNSQGTGVVDNYYDFVYQPLRGRGGIVRGVVAIAVDVTERHNTIVERDQMLDSSNRAREAAEIANRAKSEFLAVMSHELRTPLTSIGGHSEILEMGIHGALNPEQSRTVSRIQQGKEHLLRLINEVLDYSRLEAGVVDLEISRVPLLEVLNICESFMQPQMTAKGIAFSIERFDEAMVLRGDYDKVKQILLNLLSNSIKFTDSGGSITVKCNTPDNARVCVEVIDTGHGIPQDKLESMFQPFVQLEDRLRRTQEGTGLGLAISRDLAWKMNGTLTAESAVGVGSTFKLTLPKP